MRTRDRLSAILHGTIQALHQVVNPRFFQSERGYQGAFQTQLEAVLSRSGAVDQRVILEAEYQKNQHIHGTRQRPDLLIHAPREITGAQPEENNFAVIAFKYRAGPAKALQDFHKMNRMFVELSYHLGIFINVGSPHHQLDCYRGLYNHRIHAFGVQLVQRGPRIHHAWWSKSGLREEIL